MVQMAKNLVHSFYYILYQPKGVPSSRDNFSGSGGRNNTDIYVCLLGLLYEGLKDEAICFMFLLPLGSRLGQINYFMVF